MRKLVCYIACRGTLRELHTTSFVNTARATSKVMRNVTRRGNVLEELARRMRPTRIVDFTRTLKKDFKEDLV